MIGTFEGVTPGAGGTIAAFMAYSEAKRWSKRPEEFGKGSPEGVAAPECANNVVTATALVPLLSLGIPGSNSAAVLLGGFLVHGLQPGPMLFEKAPEVVYGLYGGLLIANIAMVADRPRDPHAVHLAGQSSQALADRVHRSRSSSRASTRCIRACSRSGWCCGIGVVGYVLRGCKVPLLPMVLGVVLGFMIESNYRRSLLLDRRRPQHLLHRQGLARLAAARALALTAYSLWREFAPARANRQRRRHDER